MLGLTQAEVAEKAEITEDLPRTIETDGSKSETPALGAVQHALEEAGLNSSTGISPAWKLKRREPENPFVRDGVLVHRFVETNHIGAIPRDLRCCIS